MTEGTEERKEIASLKLEEDIVEMMYQEKGRKGKYSQVVRGWMEKAHAYIELEEKYEREHNENNEMERVMVEKIKKIKALIKKLGSQELQDAIKEVLESTI